MAVIETSRLRLEPLSAAHADALYRVYSEPDVRQFLITCPNSRSDFERIFAAALEMVDSLGMWAMIDPPTRALVGRVGFYAFGRPARPELAFLLSRSFWGRGLATEAAAACLGDGFERHGWRQVVALVRPANAAAIRVATKLGMAPEQTVMLGGAPAVVYEMRHAVFFADPDGIKLEAVHLPSGEPTGS